MRRLAASLLAAGLCAAPALAQQVSDPLSKTPPAALTDSKAAAQTTDSGSFSVFTQSGITAMSIADAVCGGVAGCGYANNDAIRGINVAPAGSTVVNTTAIAGYLRNQAVSGTPPSFGQNSVLLFGSGTCEVDGCKTWGVNTVLVDAAGKGMTSGTNRVLVGAEYNFIVSNAANQPVGVMVVGDALVQPTQANAFAVLPLGQGGGATPIHWVSGFITASGAAAQAFVAGASKTSGNDVESQKLIFGYYDNTGVSGSVGIGVRTVPGWNIPQVFFTQNADWTDLFVNGQLQLAAYPPGGIAIAGKKVLQGDASGLYLGNDTAITNNVLGGANAVLSLNGTSVVVTPSTGSLKLQSLPAVAAGTGKRFLCVDTATKSVYEGSGASCN